MMRPRAVRSLLLDVAGLRSPDPEGDNTEESPRGRHPKEQRGEHLKEQRAAQRAAQRALLVVLFDATALVVLFALRDRDADFLALERSEESIMTLGILAVAVHLGFRLAQLLLYRSVARKLEELPEEL
jgi:hypothetical protein